MVFFISSLGSGTNQTMEIVFSPFPQPVINPNKLYLNTSVVKFPIGRKYNLILNITIQETDEFHARQIFSLKVVTIH